MMTGTRSATVILARSAVLLFAAALLAGCSYLEQRRHQAVLDRIAKHLNAKAPKVDVGPFYSDMLGYKEGIWPQPDVARAIVIRDLGKGLYNEFWHSHRCDRARLRAVLDRLDANAGADLDTVGGCLEIFELMLQVTATARDYGPFAIILYSQAANTFPKPGGPVEKKP